jgi:hypothetical protein
MRPALGRPINDIELGPRLIRRTAMRFEEQIPGKGGVAVVSETGVLARLRELDERFRSSIRILY